MMKTVVDATSAVLASLLRITPSGTCRQPPQGQRPAGSVKDKEEHAQTPARRTVALKMRAMTACGSPYSSRVAPVLALGTLVAAMIVAKILKAWRARSSVWCPLRLGARGLSCFVLFLLLSSSSSACSSSTLQPQVQRRLRCLRRPRWSWRSSRWSSFSAASSASSASTQSSSSASSSASSSSSSSLSCSFSPLRSLLIVLLFVQRPFRCSRQKFSRGAQLFPPKPKFRAKNCSRGTFVSS